MLCRVFFTRTGVHIARKRSWQTGVCRQEDREDEIRRIGDPRRPYRAVKAGTAACSSGATSPFLPGIQGRIDKVRSDRAIAAPARS